MFLKTLLKTNYLGRNVRSFTSQLCKFSSLYWYDAMPTSIASRCSLIMSRSLTRASTFAFSRISTRTVGIPISVGMMASIPYVKANDDIPVDFRLVVLEAYKTPRNSSTHFPLAECMLFFRVDRRVLLDASAWSLLCAYRGVKYRFLIFNLLQKFLFTRLSNCGPLSITIDWGILNLHTIFFHAN